MIASDVSAHSQIGLPITASQIEALALSMDHYPFGGWDSLAKMLDEHDIEDYVSSVR